MRSAVLSVVRKRAGVIESCHTARPVWLPNDLALTLRQFKSLALSLDDIILAHGQSRQRLGAMGRLEGKLKLVGQRLSYDVDVEAKPHGRLPVLIQDP